MAIDADMSGPPQNPKRSRASTPPPAKALNVEVRSEVAAVVFPVTSPSCGDLVSRTEELVPNRCADAKGSTAEASSGKSSPPGAAHLFACAIGLQVSYLIWGFMQEKVMTTTYDTGKFPSATFCVFSNRVFALLIGMALTRRKHGTFGLTAPVRAFAPCSLSNSVSSFAQYQALHYVSFPLQTLAKSAKIIPVMVMGKVLNGKTYAWQEYVEALVISMGVCLFSLNQGKEKADSSTQMWGVLLLAAYLAADSFTSQWQSRVYKDFPKVDQFQMMYATNAWSILLTLTTLLVSGEFLPTLEFLQANPDALIDNVAIAVTSATGQLLIFHTIKTFGPVTFTIIMTTRQMFSLMLSACYFDHIIGEAGYAGAGLVFAMVFTKVTRESKNRSKKRG